MIKFPISDLRMGEDYHSVAALPHRHYVSLLAFSTNHFPITPLPFIGLIRVFGLPGWDELIDPELGTRLLS